MRRKRKQKFLDRYRSLLRAFPFDVVVMFDLECRHVAAGGEQLEGLPFALGPIEGATVWQSFPPSVASVLAPHYQAAFAGQHVRFDLPFGDREFVVRVIPLPDDAGAIVGGMASIRDVTERSRAVRALERSERQIRIGFERSPVAMTIRAFDGEIQVANEAFAAMIGRTLEEAMHQASTEYIHPDDHARFIEVSDQFRSGEITTYTGAIRYLRPDGSVVYGHTSANVIDDDEGGRPIEVLSQVIDLTRERNSVIALVETEERFRAAFDNAPIGMALVSVDGRFLQTNEALCEFLGYGPDELLERTFQQLTFPEDLEADEAYVDRLINGQINSYQMEKRYLTSRGDVVWALLSVSLVRDDKGSPLHFISHIKDISDGRRRQEELEQLADRDPLTGVLNRRRFAYELALEEARVADGEATGAVVVIDLDDLKAVNDSLGHEGGDAFIQRVAMVMGAQIRGNDVLARIGGDEFVVLLPDVDEQHVRTVAERFLESIALPDGTQTVSIGVAMIDERAPGRSLARADAAMYQAKRAGGNRVVGPGRRHRAPEPGPTDPEPSGTPPIPSTARITGR